MKITGRLKDRYVASRVSHKHSQAISKFVTVEGARLHFVIKGTGRPVVLIHGNPGSCQDWTKLYDPLSSRCCAFAFDRPGHGHSDRPNHENVTVEVQARLLHLALAELRVERPILVGHSWGGALALAYALTHPNDVSGLVLLAPAAFESDDGVSFVSKLPALPIIGDLVNFVFTPMIAASVVRSDLKKAFAPDPVPAHYLQSVLAEWTRPRKVKWYSVDDALLDDSFPKLSSRYSELLNPDRNNSNGRDSGLRIPISIVVGDSDLIVPLEENSRRLHQVLPGSNLTVLKDTGHQIPFTRPQAVVDAVDLIASLSVVS